VEVDGSGVSQPVTIDNGSTTDTDDGTVAGDQASVAVAIAVQYGYDGTNDVRVRAKGSTPGSTEVGLVTRPLAYTDGTNTAPTMDAAARAGFQKITDGTNTLPTMDAAARKGFVQVTDGTTSQLVDPCAGNAKVYTAISQTAGTQLITGTSAKKTYVCSFFVIGADAENVSLVAGTGTVCATNTVAVIGGTSAANGPNMAANGGFVIGNGNYSIAATTVNADNLCLLQSGSGRIAGAMTSVVQ
jgi:hypothetical protein